MRTATTLDVRVENHGSIFLFHSLTDTGTEWMEQHVSEPTWFGHALAVEHRCAADLAQAMLDDGLGVG